MKLKVRNTGDRPIQVGSHYHFFEVNRALEFNRPAAFGMRLDVPATTAIRFEPGDEKEVTLVPMAGKQRVYGFANLVDGWTGGADAAYRPNFGESVKRAESLGFQVEKSNRVHHPECQAMSKMTRKEYADLFGPTTGDKIRLADSDLYIEIEKDLREYGDEAVYGGGKTLRDGMGMDNTLTSSAGALDLVITNATIVDPLLGVIKADVGIKDGRIVGVGKAGNPNTMAGVTPGLAVGPANGCHQCRASHPDSGRDRQSHPHDLPATG